MKKNNEQKVRNKNEQNHLITSNHKREVNYAGVVSYKKSTLTNTVGLNYNNWKGPTSDMLTITKIKLTNASGIKNHGCK